MDKPFKHHSFVKTAINGGASRARFGTREERDSLFSELTKHYGIDPQLKNGVNPYIAIVVPNNQKGRNNQGVARIVCTDKFVRGPNNSPIDAFDIDIDWTECYREQSNLAKAFGLHLNAFTPKALR
jgi:hypothetical protein